MKLLEMGKDIKIKHSVSSPPPPTKSGGTFFAKKTLHEGTSVFYGEMLWGNVLRGD